MNIPVGKTKAQLTKNKEVFGLKEFDVGYIDGYITAGTMNSERPYAVFVRDDGVIGLIDINGVKACQHNYN